MKDETLELQYKTQRDAYNKYLNEGVCHVEFTKLDGNTRLMLCTKNLQYIPKHYWPQSSVESHPTFIRVFDIEIQEWRGFDIRRVQSFGATVQA